METPTLPVGWNWQNFNSATGMEASLTQEVLPGMGGICSKEIWCIPWWWMVLCILYIYLGFALSFWFFWFFFFFFFLLLWWWWWWSSFSVQILPSALQAICKLIRAKMLEGFEIESISKDFFLKMGKSWQIHDVWWYLSGKRSGFLDSYLSLLEGTSRIR